MTSITNGFIRTVNSNIDLQNYMKINGITDEDKAQQELQKIYGEPEKENAPNYTTDLGSTNLDFISQQGNYNLALQNINYANDNNILSDVIADDGMSRVVTHKDGSTTEFYYNEEQQILETYEKKLNDKGEVQIVDYKQNTGVETNFIADNEALKNLNGIPTLSVKSAESFINSSNLQLNNPAIKEFTNVANIQTDYDSEGNPSCLIMLDAEGKRIGHMWLQEQDTYKDDNKVGELVMYKTGNRYQFNENGSLADEDSELSDISTKINDNINTNFKEIGEETKNIDDTSYTAEQRMQQVEIMSKYKTLEEQAANKIKSQYTGIKLQTELKSNHEYFRMLMQQELNNLNSPEN